MALRPKRWLETLHTKNGWDRGVMGLASVRAFDDVAYAPMAEGSSLCCHCFVLFVLFRQRKCATKLKAIRLWSIEFSSPFLDLLVFRHLRKSPVRQWCGRVVGARHFETVMVGFVFGSM